MPEISLSWLVRRAACYALVACPFAGLAFGAGWAWWVGAPVFWLGVIVATLWVEGWFKIER
jgi:hypothetical protein